MEGLPLPLWRDCEGRLGEAGVGGVRAQGAEGVNFCLGWKLREGVATSPPENVLSLSRGLEQRRYCGVSSKVGVQGRVSPPQAPGAKGSPGGGEFALGLQHSSHCPEISCPRTEASHKVSR